MPKVKSPLEGLKEYLPEGSYDAVVHYLVAHKVHLTITRERTTVLGNYRSKHENKNHRITVNGNLNSYNFLITLLHELGHLLAFEKYGSKIPAHGEEWKREYASILASFITQNIFPKDIQTELLRTLKNPAATACAEDSLLRILRKYDQQKPNVFLVEDLPENSYFKMKNGRLFKKGNKVRKRFLCRDVATQKNYLFSPVAEVILVKEN